MADTGASADPLKYKVVIVGASGSGKTSILERFQHGRFNPNPAVTTGVFFATKRVEINGRIMDAQLWDTAGQERFRAISTQFYRVRRRRPWRPARVSSARKRAHPRLLTLPARRTRTRR